MNKMNYTKTVVVSVPDGNGYDKTGIEQRIFPHVEQVFQQGWAMLCEEVGEKQFLVTIESSHEITDLQIGGFTLILKSHYGLDIF